MTNKALAFDRALGKTSDDLILEDQVDDHNRQGGDERASRKDTPVFGVLPGGKDLQTDHNGLHLTLSQQGTGDNEFAVGADEAQNRDNDQNRAQQGQDELVENLPVSSAINMGGLINITGNGIHITLHEPNIHSHSAAGIDQDQAEMGVESHPGNDITNLFGNGEKSNNCQKVGEALDQQNRLQHSLTTFKAKTRESKGCQSGQGNGQKRRYSRNDDRVLEPGEEGEDGVGNQLLKVLEAPVVGDEFLICQVVDRIDGRRDDPKHREDTKDNQNYCQRPTPDQSDSMSTFDG